ncbi:MAG: hypothetical protein J2P37_19260, partial [Ktedonobacteraceae bacterium]|nr:hypothetical protein [Ktedonobacteraceae bacterium]
VAIMGTILNAQMALEFAPVYARFSEVVAHLPKDIVPSDILLKPAIRDLQPGAFISQLQEALGKSLFWIYVLLLIFALVALVVMLLQPGGRVKERNSEEERTGPALANIPEAASND